MKWLYLQVAEQSRKEGIQPAETIAYRTRQHIRRIQKENEELRLRRSEEFDNIPTLDEPIIKLWDSEGFIK